MKIKIKKLHPDAKIPKYALEGDAGMDVVAIDKKVEGELIVYGTGLAFEIPKGHVLLICPRSSVTKKELFMANSVGVLDSGYRGELILKFRKVGNNEYEVGERVAQIVLFSYPEIEFKEVDELSETQRGGGGFGSTGFV